MPQPKYSREHLATVAALATSMSDFMDRLGEPHTPRKRRNLRTRLARLEISTEHWERSVAIRYANEMLRVAVEQSINSAGALQVLGVPNTGGQHAHLSRRVRRAGIDTSHFLGQAHARGKPGKRLPPDQVLVVRPPGSPRPDRTVLFNALKASGVPYTCGICGLDAEWLEKPLTLHLDHVNGDYLDNRIENLRFLCPNCHAQTSSWCRSPAARSSA